MKFVKIGNNYINVENITYIEKSTSPKRAYIHFNGEDNYIAVGFNVEDVIAFIKSSLEAENN